jgi:hypothetical protein
VLEPPDAIGDAIVDAVGEVRRAVARSVRGVRARVSATKGALGPGCGASHRLLDAAGGAVGGARHLSRHAVGHSIDAPGEGVVAGDPSIVTGSPFELRLRQGRRREEQRRRRHDRGRESQPHRGLLLCNPRNPRNPRIV